MAGRRALPAATKLVLVCIMHREHGTTRLRLHAATRLITAAALCATTILAGCRKPHVQGPLSPELRGPVRDLAAIRAGNKLWLGWTVPKRGTRKLAVQCSVKVRICWREGLSGPCTSAGDSLLVARGARGSFSEQLPAALASGPPRVLYYFVELLDRKGRSTGLSNSVATLAGAPPPAVHGLTAEMTPQGVLLRWKPEADGSRSSGSIIQLRRTELITAPPTEAMRQGSAAIPAPTEKDMIVEGKASQALDTNIRKGAVYRYRAQRVVQIMVNGQVLELAGQNSSPVKIDTSSDLPK
jgi:hypothetical protein